MIKGVKIGERIIKECPEKGYYVQLAWDTEDEDENYERFVDVGPFPEKRKDTLIRFLNVLEKMQDEYKDKEKGRKDGYDHIPGVNDFFNSPQYLEDDDEGQFIIGLEAEIEWTYGDIAEFAGFDIYYRDGESFDKYLVNIEEG